jgi:hypothetical protein
MQTNTDGQSRTCTDIVNGAQWLEAVAASLAAALQAAQRVGALRDKPAAWLDAWGDARAAEDEVVAELAEAAQHLDRQVSATQTLKRSGWRWVDGAQWVAPPPAALPPADPKPGAAVQQLEALGWRWSGWAPGEQPHWVGPVPRAVDPARYSAISKAAEVLGGLGYSWGRDVWLKPAPAPDLLKDEAIRTLSALGYGWSNTTQQWLCARPAEPRVDPARYSAICQAARRVVTAARHGMGAQEAIRALQVTLEDNDPGGWDAEALRDAALAVLRGDSDGLDRLAKAVQRTQ